MIEDFHCITISGGMFSPEFLIKIADEDTTVEGINPSTYGHEDSRNLNNYISSLWSSACHTWKTLGQKAIENGEVATHSKSFIKRLLQSMEIDVGTTICPTSGDRPQIWRQALGSVWHVIAAGAPLDDRSEAVGAKRISPHSLVQGHLNSENKHQWGVVSNGVQFRILRSNNRPSVTESIEFDLQKMFSEGHFGDFKMFFMMIHASRWPSNAPEDSPAWLDSWYKASGEQGMSVLADLQSCVEKAAECFGSGFVRLSAGNMEFRQALRDKPGLADEMQRQLMRFIYQLIFIFVTEERDILLIKSHEQMSEEQVNAVEQARMRYETSYSTKRRRSTLHRQRMDNHCDGYEEIKVILSGLRGGYDGLALPALASFLFSKNSTPLLDPLRMLNRDYIAGLNKLCKFMRDGQSHRVHWKTLRETELGSVYESLLELRPIIDMEQGTFVLRNRDGNDRQSSGSHYTPRVLVDHLIHTTVEPLLEETKSGVVRKYRGTDATHDFIKSEKIEAILSLTVCDPASGSGHFLLAALERIAVELAKIDSEEVYPAPSLIQRWKRDVASRCIYGVDLNPTAVELCKVAIWMDTYDGSRPLSFLDSHIRHGNSLLGQDTSNIGLIPDKAIANDWRVTSQEHKRFNRRERARVAKEIDSKLQKLEKALKRTYGARHDGFTLNVQLEEGGKSKHQILSEIRQLKSDREFILEKIPLGQSKLGNIIDLKSVIQSIALSQTEMNDMTESTLGELEDKSEAFNSLLSHPHKLWIKEVLDASIAMWWWPHQDSHEEAIPLPLSSLDLDSYATWLAYEHDIQDDVVSTKFGRISSTSTIQRYEQIRSWTKNIASSNSFIHWEIEFPEIFAGNEPGFSLTLGNPPFLGGAKISTAAGVETANFIRDKFQGKAKTDLIAYFFRNAHSRMSSKGRMGMVTTNSAGQGETRHTGLRRIVSSGSTICNAETDIIWPGTAAVTVDLITISKSKVKDISFNGTSVNFISSRLDLRPEFDPITLPQNTDKSQRGVNPRGPFQLDEEKAKQFLSLNTNYSEVIKPFLDGRDLTNTGVPSRHIIDFGSKSLSEAQEYSHVFQHVKDQVYPFRMGLKDKKEYASLKEKWWQYEFTAQSIQKWFVNHNTAYAKGRVASNWIFTKISSGYVCGEATVIFFFEETDKFAVLQSSLHEHWCKVFTSTLGSSGLRYTNVCINPFPFPQNPSAESVQHARVIGEKYLAARDAMVANGRTYNQIYQQIDDIEFDDDSILEIRKIVVELDKAVLDMYGWSDIQYNRECMKVGDKSRFWVNESTIEELLSRLILLNQELSVVNLDKVEINEGSMGLTDAIGKKKFGKREKVATEPSPRGLSETKGVEVAVTQTEEVGVEKSDVSDNKRFIIYGHRQSSDISDSPVNMNQVKVGSVGRAPKNSSPGWFSIDEIDHTDKETEKFNVTMQRLNDSGAIFGGTGSAVQRNAFKEDSSDMLPIIIDLKEEFPDIDWNDESKHEHSLVTVEKSWIHHNMRDRRVNPEKSNDEWFFIGEDEDPREFILNLIRTQLDRPSGKEYLKSERPHQYWARNRIQDLAESQSENENHQWDLMLELAPRFGKTSFILGYWRNNTDFPLLIIAAHVLSAHTSFTKAVQKWDTGADTEVIHLRDEGAAEKIKSSIDSSKKVVLLASQHLANTESEESEDSSSEDSSEVDTSLIDEVFEVTKQYDAVIYVDEADHGSHTSRSQMVIEAAISSSEKQRHVLHGTGTNIERASTHGRENIGLVRVTYTDILEAKKGEGFLFDESIDGLIGRDILSSEKEALDTIRADVESCRERLEHIVEPIYLRLSLTKELVTQFETDLNKNPDWINVYKNHTKSQTKNWVQSFFKHLLHDDYTADDFYLSNILEGISESEGNTASNPLETDEPVGIMVWCGQEKNHVEMMKKAAENALGSDWLYYAITGDHTNNANAEDVAKSMVRKAKVTKNSKGVIFFSSGMGSRSFSVPEISIVIDCYDGGGMYTAHQKHSRALTPNPASSKQHGFIINMAIDPNRTVSHYENKIIHDTIHSKNATEGDIKEQLAQKIRMHSLFRWSEREGSSPVLIEAAELERLALDAPRIVDMLMYDSQNLASEFDDGEGTLSLLQCLAKANSDLALTKTIERLLSKQRSGGESSDEADEEVVDDEEEAEEPEIVLEEVVEEKETLSPSDIRQLLNQLVIIVQNIGLQVTDDEADNLGDALDILEAEDLEDALKYWTGGIGIEDFKTLTDKLGPKVIDSAFRISRSSDQFDWIEEWRD